MPVTLGMKYYCECGKEGASIELELNGAYRELPKALQYELQREMLSRKLHEIGWKQEGWLEQKGGWEHVYTCPECAAKTPLKRAWGLITEGLTLAQASLYLGPPWTKHELERALLAEYGELPAVSKPTAGVKGAAK